MKIYDISVPITPQLVTWPGDPGIVLERVQDLDQGDAATVSCIQMGLHTGTHVDAPSHFLQGAKTVEKLSLDVLTGPVAVVEVDQTGQISRNTLSLLSETVPWTTLKRVLFKTRNSQQKWYQAPFDPGFTHLAPEAADFLIERGIELVGMDYLSVEGYGVEGAPVHRKLLSAGAHILEGLYLGHVPQGWYELFCLPLNIPQAEGAPARAILRETSPSHVPAWDLFPPQFSED